MNIDERMLAAGLVALKSKMVGDKMMDDISVAERISIVSEVYKAMSDAAPKDQKSKGASVPKPCPVGIDPRLTAPKEGDAKSADLHLPPLDPKSGPEDVK